MAGTLPQAANAVKCLRIIHRTYYNFPGEVVLQPHRLFLRPRPGPELRIVSSILDISPPATVRWHRDAHDNSVAVATFATRTRQLAILSEVVVQQYDATPLDFIVSDHAVQFPFTYGPEDSFALQPYTARSASVHEASLQAWIRQLWQPGEAIQTYTLLERLNLAIHGSFTYRSREQPGVQGASETLESSAGSCRDFALLFIEAARSLGFAARFVSGYLQTPPSSQDLGATHAWAEVYLPGAGWKGFDPTVGGMAGDRHVAVAVAGDPDSLPPVAGTYVGVPGASLQVGVWVEDV
jgi:transglutaminase-like putative cysteine protease